MSEVSKQHSSDFEIVRRILNEGVPMGFSLALEALDHLEEQVQAYEDEINERTTDHALTLRKYREEQERADGLKEQLEAHERVVDAARVILTLADEERDELAGEVSKYLGPWADLVEAVHAASSPAKDYELHVRTGATPSFATDDDDYPATSRPLTPENLANITATNYAQDAEARKRERLEALGHRTWGGSVSGASNQDTERS